MKSDLQMIGTKVDQDKQESEKYQLALGNMIGACEASSCIFNHLTKGCNKEGAIEM